MRRLLYLVTAITLIAAFGVISIGCICSAPPNADIKKAVLAQERPSDPYLTEEDIEILHIGMVRVIPGGISPLTVYPVKLSIRGQERRFLLQKVGSEWSALAVP